MRSLRIICMAVSKYAQPAQEFTEQLLAWNCIPHTSFSSRNATNYRRQARLLAAISLHDAFACSDTVKLRMVCIAHCAVSSLRRQHTFINHAWIFREAGGARRRLSIRGHGGQVFWPSAT